jgi:hypothetical protein
VREGEKKLNADWRMIRPAILSRYFLSTICLAYASVGSVSAFVHAAASYPQNSTSDARKSPNRWANPGPIFIAPTRKSVGPTRVGTVPSSVGIIPTMFK